MDDRKDRISRPEDKGQKSVHSVKGNNKNLKAYKWNMQGLSDTKKRPNL